MRAMNKSIEMWISN